jgi:hypothetical protein
MGVVRDVRDHALNARASELSRASAERKAAEDRAKSALEDVEHTRKKQLDQIANERAKIDQNLRPGDLAQLGKFQARQAVDLQAAQGRAMKEQAIADEHKAKESKARQAVEGAKSALEAVDKYREKIGRELANKANNAQDEAASDAHAARRKT